MADLLKTTRHKRSLLVTLLLALYIATLSGAPVQENVKYDFSEICPGIRLKHGNRVLNKRDLTFTEADLASLEPYLHNQPLADRMDVWCKTAERQSEVAESTGKSKWSETDISNVDIVEGDIILTKDTIHHLTGHKERPGQTRPKRQMMTTHQWPKGEIPYRFHEDASITEAQKTGIREQLDKFKELTCLRFMETSADTKTSHLVFNTKGEGCYSTVGRSPKPQDVNLGHFSCFWPGKTQHEVGHAIGLVHEHNRPDRDSYVTIDAAESQKGNFRKSTWEDIRTYGVPYDYTSVMHYDGENQDYVIVMTPKDTVMVGAMGVQDGLTLYDTKIINLRYCPDKCAGGIEWDKCKRGGYRNVNNCGECLCPTGFAPPFCEEIAAHGGENHAKCGERVDQSLEAAADPKSISSPWYDPGHGNYPGYPPNVACNWMIKAPSSKVVSATFIGKFDINSGIPCGNYVELRYKNMALPGPRLCGRSLPQGSFVSHGQEMLVRFSIGNAALDNLWDGFTLQYQAMNCGGCSRDAADKEPACNYPTKLYSCDVRKPERKNTCFDIEPKPYCCKGFTLSKRSCQRARAT